MTYVETCCSASTDSAGADEVVCEMRRIEREKQPDVVFSRQSHGCDVAGGPARSSMSMYNFLRRGLKERLNSTAITRNSLRNAAEIAAYLLY